VRVLVTGANGFLGRHVVAALLGAGHSVRALVRPSAAMGDLGWEEDVEVLRADLCSDPNLGRAFVDLDAVIHLAASMSGSDFSRFNETVVGTERFLDAMSRSSVRRLVLCSSFSVYDWSQASGTVDEELPLLSGPDVYARGGYAAAKVWQERLARRASEAYGYELTVLRPGFIWGPGNECPLGSLGPSLGRARLVLGPGRQLPFTHVCNTADCLRAAVSSDGAIGKTMNVVDDYPLSAWRFAGEYLRRSGARGTRIWIPHWPLRPTIWLVHRIARLVLGPHMKLPAMFVPARFAQSYRPLRYSTRTLRAVLGWQPPLGLEEALQQTFSARRSDGAAPPLEA